MKYSNERIYEGQLPPEYIEHMEYEQVCGLLVSLADVIIPDKIYSIELHKERIPYHSGHKLFMSAKINEAREEVINLYKPENVLLTPKKTFIERLKVCFKYLKTKW